MSRHPVAFIAAAPLCRRGAAGAQAAAPLRRTHFASPRALRARPPACAAPRRAPTASASTSPDDAAAAPPSALSAARSAAAQGASLVLLLLIQRGVARLLARLGLAFPAPLGAMLLLFGLLSASRFAGLSPAVDRASALLFAPGVAFLTRWLAVFFVPNLVMLPLAPPLPPPDLPRIALILVAGFFATLLSAAAACAALRALVRALTNKPPAEVPPALVSAAPPSGALITSLTAVAAVSLALAARAADPTAMPARVYALAVTLLTFCVGQRFARPVKRLLHPLITCTGGTIAAMALLGAVTGAGFRPALAAYYIRSGAAWGGGNVLAALLGPAVITFAFTMDAQRRLAKARLVEVVGVSLFATLSGLFGTAFAARLLRMSPASRLIVIPRMITAPLAIAISELLGANVGLAASIVALTGLLGANVAATVLSALGVKDPVARGLAIGASAHGLGTAALSDEGSAFPFAALAMTLVGIFSTVLVAYAPFRALLLRAALGKVCLQAPVAQ